jgi:3-oxoacyl-[acyl-carrier-protein] synthase-3
MIESRACSRVLLLAGDAGFCHLNPANRITAPVFGDAGSASLVEYSDTPNPLSFAPGTDGSGCEAIIRPGGGARIPHLPSDTDGPYMEEVLDASGQPWRAATFGNLWMDGAAVLDFSMSVVPAHITAHLEHRGIKPQDLDYLVLHQANKQIVQSVGRAAGFASEQVPWKTLSKYGNQSSASIPTAICDQLGDAGRDLRLMLCGYGIGLSWASCLGSFPELHISGVHDFVPSGSPLRREERIAYWHRKLKGENNG